MSNKVFMAKVLSVFEHALYWRTQSYSWEPTNYNLFTTTM